MPLTQEQARKRATAFLDCEEDIRDRILIYLAEYWEESPARENLTEEDLDQVEYHVHDLLRKFYDTEWDNIRVVAEHEE